MHSVVTSADERRAARRRDIVLAAQDLTIDRGYHAWTLDDLAEVVGVSRRTLYNDVGGKERCVLGPRLTFAEPVLDTFRRGGPTGHLIDDIIAVAQSRLREKYYDAAHWRRVQAVLDAAPGLRQHLESEVEEAIDALVGDALRRPGESEDRVRVAIGICHALVAMALARHRPDKGAEPALTTILDDLVPLAHDVFRPTRTP